MSTDNIKKKIAALLNKTVSNGATEAEAEAALSKAKDLMVEYYISENELHESNPEKEYVMDTTKAEKVNGNMNITNSFCLNLSKLFDCVTFMKDKYVFFYGEKDNVSLCMHFYQYVINTFKHEMYLYSISLEADDEMKKGLTKHAVLDSFLKGMVFGLCEKLRMLYMQRNKEIVETGIVLYDKRNEAKDKLKENYKITVREITTNMYAKSREAMQEGNKVGKSMNFSREVDQNNQKAIGKY